MVRGQYRGGVVGDVPYLEALRRGWVLRGDFVES